MYLWCDKEVCSFDDEFSRRLSVGEEEVFPVGAVDGRGPAPRRYEGVGHHTVVHLRTQQPRKGERSEKKKQ